MAKILRDIETTQELVRVFGVSRVTVWKALEFKTNSPLAERIRRRAIQLGCVIKQDEQVKTLNNKNEVINTK